MLHVCCKCSVYQVVVMQAAKYSRGGKLMEEGESQTVLSQQTGFVRRTEGSVRLKMKRLQHWRLVPRLHSFFLSSCLLPSPSFCLYLSFALSHFFASHSFSQTGLNIKSRFFFSHYA